MTATVERQQPSTGSGGSYRYEVVQSTDGDSRRLSTSPQETGGRHLPVTGALWGRGQSDKVPRCARPCALAVVGRSADIINVPCGTEQPVALSAAGGDDRLEGPAVGWGTAVGHGIAVGVHLTSRVQEPITTPVR